MLEKRSDTWLLTVEPDRGFFLIGIRSMQGWTAMELQEKEEQKD